MMTALSTVNVLTGTWIVSSLSVETTKCAAYVMEMLGATVRKATGRLIQDVNKVLISTLSLVLARFSQLAMSRRTMHSKICIFKV